jgi:hypothetical protein
MSTKAKTTKTKAVAKTKATTKPAPVQKTRSLYEISKDYSELEILLDSIDGDISPDQQKQLDEFLSGLGTERNQKIDNYCKLIRNLEGRQKVRAEEAKRFSTIAKYDANKIVRLKYLLLEFFKLHGIDKIETDLFRVVRAQNGVAPVKLGERFEENPEELPEEYRLTTYKPNLKKIAEDLKEGVKLDFASFDEKGENIRIG